MREPRRALRALLGKRRTEVRRGAAARLVARVGLGGVILACVLMAMAFAGAGVADADSFSWSTPIGLDPTGGNVPSRGWRARPGRQCTAVDDFGREVTFDPTTGKANAAGVTPIDSGNSTGWRAYPRPHARRSTIAATR